MINRKGIAFIEYLVLFLILITVFIVMQGFLQRSIYGNWAKTGQSFAFGRQWDAQKSLECSYDEVSNQWYDQTCYQAALGAQPCQGDVNCEEKAVQNCLSGTCNKLNSGDGP